MNNYEQRVLNLLTFDKEKIDIITEVRNYILEGNTLALSAVSSKKRNVNIKIRFIAPSILRFQMAVEKKIPVHNTYMLAESNFPEMSVEMKDKDKSILLKTKKFQVIINSNPWFFSILNRQNIPILQEEHNTRRWYPDGDFLVPPLSIQQEGEEFRFFQSFSISPGEQFWGMGEHFGSINLFGQEIFSFLKAEGFGSEKYCLKPINFFLSSKGYGIFINTYRPVAIDFGKRYSSVLTFAVEDTLLDIFIFIAPTLKEIIELYTRITGKPQLPPKWSFGIWMSRDSYRTSKEVLEIAKELRKKKLPCDVIHIDPGWMLTDDRIPYYGRNEYGCYWDCNLEWNSHFPEPEKMLSSLKEKRFKVSLWEIPRFKINSVIYKEAEKKGYLVRKKDGSIYNTFFGAYFDFTNKEAVKWFKKIHKKLLSQGVACFKADSGVGGPEDGIYRNMGALDAKQIYSFLYNKALFEVVKEVYGEGFVWASTGFSGSQRYPILWGGDPRGLYCDMASSLRSALSLGLSGIPFWSMDIGGWWFPLTENLYIRMMQLGMFCSHVRFHGNTPREPWHFGEKAVALYRKYAKLRYRLIPYIYSQSYLATKTGLPIMRALVLEFPEDPATYCIDDEFLFGDSILVAPILSNLNTRFIYLPEGIWYDFWSKKVYSGPSVIKYYAPISTLPLFTRGDRIIPMGPSTNYIDEKPLDPLYLDIYIGKKKNPTGFLYHEGKEYRFTSTYTSGKFKINLCKNNQNYEIKIYGLLPPKKVYKVEGKKQTEIRKVPNYCDLLKGKEGYLVRKDYIMIKAGKFISPASIILKGRY